MRGFEAAVTKALLRPRPLWLLLGTSLLLGTGFALSILPVGLIAGQGPFWEFPAGTVPGAFIDMAQAFSGYLYIVQAPWSLPLLHVGNLAAPTGFNAFWLDPLPWVSLLGKAIFTVTGLRLNLLGLFMFGCFALPGVPMTALLWVAGQRGLMFAVAGSVLTDAMPPLLFEWGHIALCAHFLLVVALLLYLLTQQDPRNRRIAAGWFALLVTAALTHVYLFAMVGAIWAAALLQAWLNRRVRLPALLGQAAVTIVVVTGIMVLTGILDADVRSGGTDDFGTFSMNLGSPVIPQLSGALPPLRTYWIGSHTQVFDYLGLGVLALLLACVPVIPRFAAGNIRPHAAILVVCTLFYLFALSNKITLGSHVLLQLPLPEQLAFVFGTFRASGRFFWPVAYALTALGIVVVSRSWRPPVMLAVLMIACVLQLLDIGPVRRAVAESTTRPRGAVLDRAVADRMISGARAVMIFPTAGCVDQARLDERATAVLLQATVELELIAARHNLPVNSVVRPRIKSDCTAEIAAKRQPLVAGTAYFYLTPFVPDSTQQNDAPICTALDWYHVCEIPAAATGQVSFPGKNG